MSFKIIDTDGRSSSVVTPKDSFIFSPEKKEFFCFVFCDKTFDKILSPDSSRAEEENFRLASPSAATHRLSFSPLRWEGLVFFRAGAAFNCNCKKKNIMNLATDCLSRK